MQADAADAADAADEVESVDVVPGSPRSAARWRLEWLALGVLLALNAAAVAWTAWVADDAFITFRTVDNALAGHGLVWNVGERVQTYTHPLWMGLLLAVSGLGVDVYAASLLLGSIGTGAALWIGALACRAGGGGVAGRTDRAGWALALSMLLASRAWVDYATSGLENPLSHLLLAAVAATTLRAEPGQRAAGLRVALLAGCLLTRLDLLFAALPALLFAWRRDGWPRPRTLLLGAAPLLAWELFSIIYYGALIANSALAKLSSGLGASALLPQGLAYLGNSLRSDPVTLLATGVGVALALRSREAAARALAVGIALQLAWTVWVGGDFMSGRFLTPTLGLGVLLVARSRPSPRIAWPAAALLTGLAVAVPHLSPFFARDYGEEWHAAIDDAGIADERHFHRDTTSLVHVLSTGGWQSDPERARTAATLERWFEDPAIVSLTRAGILAEGSAWPPGDAEAAVGLRPLLVKGGVGLLGYRFGPGLHVLDYHGLGDPLLARMPAVERDPVLAALIPRLAKLPWRVGHYLRRVPAGYAASLSTGENRIEDPELARVYEDLRLVTRGPPPGLFDRERLAAIWRLNVGSHTAVLRRSGR